MKQQPQQPGQLHAAQIAVAMVKAASRRYSRTLRQTITAISAALTMFRNAMTFIPRAWITAAPNAPAFFALGYADLSAPFLGGTLVPDVVTPPGKFLSFVTNAAGALTLGSTWPTGLPAGIDVYLQAWVQDAGAPFGYAASNALRATTP